MATPTNWPDDAVRQLHQLERNNGELVARLMRIQGETDQITDIEIQEAFSKLRDTIVSWIQAVHRHLRETQHGWHPKDVLLRQVRLDPSMGRPEYIKWLVDYNSTTSVVVVLSKVIWRHLDENIFQTKDHSKHQMWLPIGMPENLPPTFEELFNSLKAAEDGEVAANRWRSTTLTGLIRTKSAQVFRSQQTEKAFNGISRSLRGHLGITNVADTLAEYLPRLQQDIVEFAADLYQRISCSRHQYFLEAPDVKRGQRLRESDLPTWHLKNTRAWIDVSSEDDAHGVVCLLFPGIRRRSTSTGKGLQVVKPLILVYDESSPDPPSDSEGVPGVPEDEPSGPEETTSEATSTSETSDGEVDPRDGRGSQPDAANEYARASPQDQRSNRMPEQGRAGQSLPAAPKSSATDPGMSSGAPSSKPSRQKGRRHSGSGPSRSSNYSGFMEPLKRKLGNTGSRPMWSGSRRLSKDSDADQRAFTASPPPASPTQTRSRVRRSEAQSLSSDDSSRGAREPTPPNESRSRRWRDEGGRRDPERTPRGTTENLLPRERSGSFSTRPPMELTSGEVSSSHTRGRSGNAARSQVRSSTHPADPGRYNLPEGVYHVPRAIVEELLYLGYEFPLLVSDPRSFVVSHEIVADGLRVSRYIYE